MAFGKTRGHRKWPLWIENEVWSVLQAMDCSIYSRYFHVLWRKYQSRGKETDGSWFPVYENRWQGKQPNEDVPGRLASIDLGTIQCYFQWEHSTGFTEWKAFGYCLQNRSSHMSLKKDALPEWHLAMVRIIHVPFRTDKCGEAKNCHFVMSHFDPLI